MGLFTQDAFTAKARSVVVSAAEPLLVSDLATAEFASVISRLVRTGDMAATDAQMSFATLDVWKARSTVVVETRPSDLAAAEAAMRRLTLSLRTPDALHAAIAMRVAATLVTFDRRLARDARSLGSAVLEP